MNSLAGLPPPASRVPPGWPRAQAAAATPATTLVAAPSSPPASQGASSLTRTAAVWSIIRFDGGNDPVTLATGPTQSLASGDKIGIRIIGSVVTALLYTPLAAGRTFSRTTRLPMHIGTPPPAALPCYSRPLESMTSVGEPFRQAKSALEAAAGPAWRHGGSAASRRARSDDDHEAMLAAGALAALGGAGHDEAHAALVGMAERVTSERRWPRVAS